MIDLPDAPKYEIFDYPGEYVVKGDGDPVTKVRMEEEEAGYDVVTGAEPVLHLHPRRQVHARGARRRRRERRLRHHLDPARGDRDQLRVDRRRASATATSFTCIPDSVIVPPAAGHAQADRPGAADGGRDRARRARRSTPTSTAGSRSSSSGTARARRTRTARAGSGSPSSGPARTGASSATRGSARR